MVNSQYGNHESRSEDEVSWPQLLSKTVDDLSRIGRTEIELLEASLKRLIEAQTDNIAGTAVMVFALAYSSLFLLGGIVLLVHLWLAWWLSFLITGFAIAFGGLAFYFTMKSSAQKKAALTKPA